MSDISVAPHGVPSPDLFQLEQDAAEIAAQARSANTIRAYKADWGSLRVLVQANGLQAIPALPRTVALYMTAHKDALSMSTLNRRLSSIAAAHRWPTTHSIRAVAILRW